MSDPHDDEFFSRISITKKLSKYELERLKKYLHPHTFSEGELIFRRGGPGRAIYFIRSGEAVVKLRLSAEHEIVLATLAPGDILGEVTFFTEASHVADVICATDLHCERLMIDGFANFARDCPQGAIRMCAKLSEVLANRLHDTDQLMMEILLHEDSEHDLDDWVDVMTKLKVR